MGAVVFAQTVLFGYWCGGVLVEICAALCRARRWQTATFSPTIILVRTVTWPLTVFGDIRSWEQDEYHRHRRKYEAIAYEAYEPRGDLSYGLRRAVKRLIDTRFAVECFLDGRGRSYKYLDNNNNWVTCLGNDRPVWGRHDLYRVVEPEHEYLGDNGSSSTHEFARGKLAQVTESLNVIGFATRGIWEEGYEAVDSGGLWKDISRQDVLDGRGRFFRRA